MASMGPEGVEKLTGQLNKYFDMMISNIYRHGGDIVKVKKFFPGHYSQIVCW
jgi:hypothetical protein